MGVAVTGPQELPDPPRYFPSEPGLLERLMQELITQSPEAAAAHLRGLGYAVRRDRHRSARPVREDPPSPTHTSIPPAPVLTEEARGDASEAEFDASRYQFNGAYEE